MTSAELNKMLVDKLPNLQEKYLDESSWQEGDDTGSHVIYGDVLTPYIIECIVEGRKKEAQIAFDYLEELLKLDDQYVEEVVALSVFESLAFLFKERKYLFSHLGERSQSILHQLL